MASKRCSKCGEEKPLSEYYPRSQKRKKDNRDGLRNECKLCTRVAHREWRERYPEKVAERVNNARLKIYGLTAAQYEEMYNSQNGCCAICEKKLEKMSVDHDHVTKKVRSLLCRSCNTTLGHTNDSPLLLISMAKYLIKHKARGINWNVFSLL